MPPSVDHIRAVTEAYLARREEVDGYTWRPFVSAASPTVRAKLALLP